jgi:hypothetical protein
MSRRPCRASGYFTIRSGGQGTFPAPPSIGAKVVLTRIVVAASLLLVGDAVAQAARRSVYLLTGQSNSLGTTNLEGPSFDPGTHPADAVTGFFWSNVSTSSSDPNNVVLYGDSGGAVTTLQMQQGDGGGNRNFWGPEFGMARTLFDAGNSQVTVIKLSRGGGGNGFWLPASGHMHNHLLSQIDVALGAIQSAGDTFDVKGFVYLQGESNNSSEAAAAGTRLQALIDDVRTHINTNFTGAANDMYSVIGEIAASTSNANRILTTDQQRELAAAGTLVGFVPTRDQALKSDGIHFGKGAKLEIGRRFADAFTSQAWVESPRRIAGYAASQGTAAAVPHPIVQGLSESGRLVPGVTFGEVDDAGVPAWRIVDNSRNADPVIQQEITAESFQQMFDQGWELNVTAKVIAGGGQALWSISQANDPGWGLTADGVVCGVQLDRVAGDQLQVRLWDEQSLVNLGPGSADAFHTFRLSGTAGSSLFDFFIDGQLQSVGNSLAAGSGLAGFGDGLVFRSGSIGGTGREVHWNEVSLTLGRVPEPASWVGLVICAALAGRPLAATKPGRSRVA